MASSVRSARCPDASSPGGGLYRPRSPRSSPLWQCAQRHAGELRASGRVQRIVEQQVIERFIACGDPHEGFARIYCDACRHEFLLAYSCKTRYFCPSCHQKRVILYGEWVEQNVLAPVAHRQYVFTLPKRLRPIFSQHRAWLGELCHKRNFQVMPGGEWLELLCKHIPDRYEHLVRYVGWYSNRARNERAKALKSQDPVTQPAASRDSVSEFATRAKATWARLIRKVYEADPLECPKCRSEKTAPCA